MMNSYYEGVCAKCGKDEGDIDVHHKDGNHDNDVLENMIYLCHKCHMGWHAKKWDYKDFGLENVHLIRIPLKRGTYRIKNVKERREMIVWKGDFALPRKGYNRISQVSDVLGVSQQEVIRMCNKGEIGASRLGGSGSWIIHSDSIKYYREMKKKELAKVRR